MESTCLTSSNNFLTAMGIKFFLLDLYIVFTDPGKSRHWTFVINLSCINGHSTCFTAVHEVQTDCINTAKNQCSNTWFKLWCSSCFRLWCPVKVSYAANVSGVHAASIFRAEEQAKQSCVHSQRPILPPFLPNATFTLCLASTLKVEVLQIMSTRCHHHATRSTSY